ncbi:Hexaprenyldihydroxybenzoate methyltransferase, mitochondrial [Coemansia sp. RSA 486]|nr:Hexaprenyldihydroxybenzoate methyltransferase, mitochondrial [Coemansia sp. RSA 486]
MFRQAFTRKTPSLNILKHAVSNTLRTRQWYSSTTTKATDTVSSVTPGELEKFTRISDTWWDTQGPFKYLHTMNTTRMQYISRRLQELYSREWADRQLSVVDIGCGGGLATESLARMGMRTLGIDAGLENIQVAKLHSEQDPSVYGNIEYRQMTAEQAVQAKMKFNCVVSLEVIEHVRDPVPFVKSLVDLLEDNGVLFISTMNRTVVSLVVDILVPEYLLGSVPKGTHQFNKFLEPEELANMVRAANAEMVDVQGLVLEPISNSCHLVPRDFGLLRNVGVQANYIICARKKK